MSAPESWYVTRTLAALELLAFGPASASEVAHGLQVHPRTARRMLSRLAVDGYVRRTERAQRYEPTMRLVALAGQIVERSALARQAVPHVRALRERTGATAHLGVPSYDSVLCLVHADERAACGSAAAPQLRELAPSHCTAAGLALLAWRHRWRRDLLSRPLVRHTDRTVVDVAALERAAIRVRRCGYAVEDGEYRHGLRAAAAPVFSESGEPVAALSISGSSARLSDLDAAGRHVLAAASALSAALGFDLGASPGDARSLRLA